MEITFQVPRSGGEKMHLDFPEKIQKNDPKFDPGSWKKRVGRAYGQFPDQEPDQKLPNFEIKNFKSHFFPPKNDKVSTILPF